MRILVGDDHPLYLEAVCEQLSRAFPDADIVRAATFSDVLDLVEQGSADLMMLDFSMPGTDGVVGVRQVVKAMGLAPVLVMSGVASSLDALTCIEAGAKGFLPKTLEGRAFMAGVAMVLSGGTYVPTEVMADAHRSYQAARFRLEDLSRQEITMLELLVGGGSNKGIAREMKLEEATVKFYFTRLFRKLGVRNRAQAAVVGIQVGLKGRALPDEDE